MNSRRSSLHSEKGALIWIRVSPPETGAESQKKKMGSKARIEVAVPGRGTSTYKGRGASLAGGSEQRMGRLVQMGDLAGLGKAHAFILQGRNNWHC